MIEEHWIDLICYSIHFTNNSGSSFCRSIALPNNFPEDKISTFFKNHFEGHDIKIIDISEINDVWLSKHAHSPFMRQSSECDELKWNL